MLECNMRTLLTIMSIYSNPTMKIISFKPYGGYVKVSVTAHNNETIYKIKPDNTKEFNALYQQAVEEKTRKEMQSHNSDWGYAPRRESINHYKCN